MALSALLWLCEGKALFVVVRPSSSGITGEAVNEAVIFQRVVACIQAVVHSCTCAFDFETPSERVLAVPFLRLPFIRLHVSYSLDSPFSGLTPDTPRYPSFRLPVPSVCF
jgi:hypothetical protein